MSITRTLNAYFDYERVHYYYDVLPHPEAFRAVEIGHTLETPEKEMAKVVIVKVEKRGLPVYVDQSLTEYEEIVFQTGTHSDAIRMRYWDFAALVFPVVTGFHRSPTEVW
jgi:Ala-tRNA(Pro) deacylase